MERLSRVDDPYALTVLNVKAWPDCLLGWKHRNADSGPQSLSLKPFGDGRRCAFQYLRYGENQLAGDITTYDDLHVWVGRATHTGTATDGNPPPSTTTNNQPAPDPSPPPPNRVGSEACVTASIQGNL